MNRLLGSILLLSTLVLAGCPVPSTPPTPVGTWQINALVPGIGGWMYVPKKYTHKKPVKVLVSCHGTPPFDVASHHIDTWKWYGEKYGCIIICPDMAGTDGILGDGPVHAMIENEKRILTIIGTLSYRYNLDRNNMMITGFSGGGFPVYWVGLRHPDLFSTVIAQNCNFNERNLDGWYPPEARKSAIFIYYGKDDPGPIKVQSDNGIRYLRSRGFNVKTHVIKKDRTGHDRHPEVAMAFFKQQWRQPKGTLDNDLMVVSPDTTDRDLSPRLTEIDPVYTRRGPAPPLP